MSSAAIASMLLGSVILQVIAIAFMPLSRGYTVPHWSLASALFFAGGIWLMGRLSASGVGISVIIPLVSAMIPLASIAVGILVFQEPASAVKISMLVTACALAGYASSLS